MPASLRCLEIPIHKEKEDNMPRNDGYVNKLMGFVLWNELLTGQTVTSIYGLADKMGVEFPTRILNRCYLVISGMERRAYRTYGVGAIAYDDLSTHLWEELRPALESMGFECAYAMQIYDDNKRLVYILSPVENKAAVSVCQAAELIHTMLQDEFDGFTKGDALLSNFTVYSEELHGVEEIIRGFEQLCHMHQLIFFSPQNKVLDVRSVREMSGGTSQSELLQDIRDLFLHIHNADTQAASALLQIIFCKLKVSVASMLCNRIASTIITRLIEACQMFDLPLEEIQRIDPMRSPTISALEDVIAETVCSISDAIGKTQQYYSPLTRSSILYIKQHYQEDIELQTLAERAGVAPAYLSRIFNRDVKMSIPSYILHQRILNAKKMLSNTTLSIAQIAQKNGFSNASYFCKLFRREESISPAAFRDQCRTHD